MAAAIVAAWALADSAIAAAEALPPWPFAAPYAGVTSAGASVRAAGGWTARLFVSRVDPLESGGGEGFALRPFSTVGAQLTRKLTDDTRIAIDVFNVFDQRPGGGLDYHSASRMWSRPGAGEPFLFHPAEPRGFRISIRTTF